MDKVAIVILNWNGTEMLRSFLPCVLKNSNAPGRTVYVADNGSTDGSVDFIRNTFPDVKLIRLDDNYGFAQGYNLALEQVEGEYVVLLNSDVEVTPDWLDPLVQYMDSHWDVAACQPKIRSWNQKDHFEHAGASGGFIDRYGYPFCRGRIMSVIEKDNGQYESIIPVLWATGAALFIRLAAYREAGGLDPRFFAHMEEIDLCWRLRSRGFGIVCIPQSIVYHVGAATLKKENSQKTFLNFRNNLLMLYKNLPGEELKPVMRMRRWLDNIAALTFVLKGQLSNAKAVWKARKEFKKIVGDFTDDRIVNMKAVTADNIPQRMSISILWQFYIKGKKYFSQLITKNDE